MVFSPSNFFKSTVNLTVKPVAALAGAANSACGDCAVSVLCAGCEVLKCHDKVNSSILAADCGDSSACNAASEASSRVVRRVSNLVSTLPCDDRRAFRAG